MDGSLERVRVVVDGRMPTVPHANYLALRDAVLEHSY
jgi:hypothetical protein